MALLHRGESKELMAQQPGSSQGKPKALEGFSELEPLFAFLGVNTSLQQVALSTYRFPRARVLD